MYVEASEDIPNKKRNERAVGTIPAIEYRHRRRSNAIAREISNSSITEYPVGFEGKDAEVGDADREFRQGVAEW